MKKLLAILLALAMLLGSCSGAFALNFTGELGQ